jgi:hypothetical protein
MNPANVLISVPTRGQIQWATVTRLQAIRDDGGYPKINYQPGNLSVALTRNTIVRTFLNGNWDVCVMVDDDIVPSPHFLDEVLDHVGEYGMIALPHPMPHPKDPSLLLLSVFDDIDGQITPKQTLEHGLHEADIVATGCVAISRAALEATGPAPFRISHDPDDPVNTDDFVFCRDLRVLGFKVGYWYDGWFADHHPVTMLAPLMERRLEGASHG